MESPYDILDVPSTATLEDIKKAYRKAATRYHPGHNTEKCDYRRIQKAYDILADPEKRRIYDTTGKVPEVPDCSELLSLFFPDINIDKISTNSSDFRNFFSTPSSSNDYFGGTKLECALDLLRDEYKTYNGENATQLSEIINQLQQFINKENGK